uniref:Uncharacterized protein n=1 Tax=Arundo donax TaxID=35708 RepID=A0A0A9FP08_ARUDO
MHDAMNHATLPLWGTHACETNLKGNIILTKKQQTANGRSK